MATVTDVQAAFDAYVTAVNAKLAAVPVAEDLDPLATDIANATAALNPAPVEEPS